MWTQYLQLLDRQKSTLARKLVNKMCKLKKISDRKWYIMCTKITLLLTGEGTYISFRSWIYISVYCECSTKKNNLSDIFRKIWIKMNSLHQGNEIFKKMIEILISKTPKMKIADEKVLPTRYLLVVPKQQPWFHQGKVLLVQLKTQVQTFQLVFL